MTVEILLAAASVGFFFGAMFLFALALCRAAAAGDRVMASAREDVHDRAVERERLELIRRRERQLVALDDMGSDLANVVPLERKQPAQVVPIRDGPIRRGGGWQK